jgi:hypothetical protein
MIATIDIGNVVTMGQILEFEAAFPGEEKLTVEQYLAGSSREMILNAAAFFLGLRIMNQSLMIIDEFLGMFFRSRKQRTCKL